MGRTVSTRLDALERRATGTARRIVVCDLTDTGAAEAERRLQEARSLTGEHDILIKVVYEDARAT